MVPEVNIIMKYIFKNHIGKVENKSLNLCEVEAVDVSTDEILQAMEEGFYSHYINDTIKWRQARLVRINLEEFDKSAIEFNYKLEEPSNINRLNVLYDTYMDQRGYYKHPGDKDFSINDRVIKYIDKSGTIIGYSKICIIDNVVDLKLFCVEDNNIDITSQHTLDFELDLFKNKNFRYAYLGPSYQRSSVFKSKIPGFEWWTGEFWSTDVREFHRRCMND